MYYRTASLLPTTQYEDIIEKVNEIINVYEKEGFKIVEINCDKEFKKAMNIVSPKRKIKMNYCNSKEHIPYAERNNRTLEE